MIVTIQEVAGSSRKNNQNLLFFKKNIKSRKAKILLVGRQNPSSRVFRRTALNSSTQLSKRINHIIIMNCAVLPFIFLIIPALVSHFAVKKTAKDPKY